mmetsp:Transcript_20975/g.54102  ORF Transcript_20975/g.54102 Transcript_20975/m.54102 type:complete len:85 (-) Transcript_20975:142-396(-)
MWCILSNERRRCATLGCAEPSDHGSGQQPTASGKRFDALRLGRFKWRKSLTAIDSAFVFTLKEQQTSLCARTRTQLSRNTDDMP